MTAPASGPEVAAIERLLEQAFGPSVPVVMGVQDVAGGRGVFSRVLRLDLGWGHGEHGGDGLDRPPTVVAKLPDTGANGRAAAQAGAYRREAMVYRQILPRSPLATPRCYAIEGESGDLPCLLLEDLSSYRRVDQMEGMSARDVEAVARALARFHRHWQGGDPDTAGRGGLRRSAVAAMDPRALAAGVEAVRHRWGDRLDRDVAEVFARLANGYDDLSTRFDRLGPLTVCHGDPRSDNLCFDRDGAPVLFDWQQAAVQFGESDLAWLAATSMEPSERAVLDQELVAAYGGDFDRYRTGMILPGLACLLLAQRTADTERTRQLIATSLRRIGAALSELEVHRLTH